LVQGPIQHRHTWATPGCGCFGPMRLFQAMLEPKREVKEEADDEEVADLRAKLEALRAAVHREQLRVAATSLADAAGRNTSKEVVHPEGAATWGTQFYHIDKEACTGNCSQYELDDMHAITHFLPNVVAAADAAGGGHRLAPDSRGGKDSLTNEVKDTVGTPPRGVQSKQDTEAALLDIQPSSVGTVVQVVVTPPQAATPEPIAWSVAGGSAAGGSTTGGVSEKELLELAHITEKLTDALEISRTAEEAARRGEARAAMLLENERAWRAGYEQALKTSHEACKVEAAQATALQAQLAERNRMLEEMHIRLRQVEVESGLERALASKGQSMRSRLINV